MSTWYDINNPEDVEVNNTDNTLEVYIGEDYGGAIYVSVPMDLVYATIEKDRLNNPFKNDLIDEN